MIPRHKTEGDRLRFEVAVAVTIAAAAWFGFPAIIVWWFS